MSRRAPRSLLFGLMVVLAAPLPVRGQQHTEQELLQTLDSLVPLLKDAREDARKAREEYRKQMDNKLPTHEIQVGLLRLLVLPGEEETARDVVGRVWRQDYASWLDRSPSLGRGRVFFQWSVELAKPEFRSFDVRAVQGERWRSRGYMEAGIREVISQALQGDLVNTPLASTWALPDMRPPQEPANLTRQMMVTPSVAVRNCLGGDDQACLRALALRVDDTPLDEWYTPAERRLLVIRHRARYAAGGNPALYACEREASLEWCDGLLEHDIAVARGPQSYLWMAPLSGPVRSSLVWYAVSRGGKGAWDRFVEHTDEGALQALEAASGSSGEELVAEWRAWLLDQSPVTQAGVGATAAKALVWILLLFAFATRSTRWRLG